jgi:hypothetical protein
MQCQFNVQSKLDINSSEASKNVNIKPGKKRGVPTNPDKQFHCPATLKYRLKPCKIDNCNGCGEYNLKVTLHHTHNYDVVSGEALFYKDVNSDVTE